MELADADWTRLREMRARYLEGGQGERRVSSWRSARDLELYDATFGARIGWKWRAVLAELRALGFRPPPGPVVDWGCGTAVAARELLGAFAPSADTDLLLWDRSLPALRFAEERVRARWPALRVRPGAPPEDIEPAVLLASHVLGELDERELEELLQLARRSAWVVWVEPGERAVSRRLARVRERLLGEHEVLAPCTHQAACGALALEGSWCHHFARPPEEAFRSRLWALVSRELGIDLRSLPYSYLVLRRGAAGSAASGALRVLGRPRLEKGRARLDACDASGVREVILLERTAGQAFKVLERAAGERLVWRWREERGRVIALEAGPGIEPKA